MEQECGRNRSRSMPEEELWKDLIIPGVSHRPVPLRSRHDASEERLFSTTTQAVVSFPERKFERVASQPILMKDSSPLLTRFRRVDSSPPTFSNLGSLPDHGRQRSNSSGSLTELFSFAGVRKTGLRRSVSMDLTAIMNHRRNFG